MTNEEKATFVAESKKPCTDDFFNGVFEGVLIVLQAQDSYMFDAETNTQGRDSIGGGGVSKPTDG
jgi:hypothetical protein